MTHGNALNRLLLDNLTTAVILLDAHLCMEYINPAAEMILAVSSLRHIGQPVGECFSLPVEEGEALKAALQLGYPFTRRETRLALMGGSCITVDYTVTPVTAQDGSRLLLEIYPRDRLLRYSREEAQLSVQEASRQLVKGMAHEIKNPLGGIRGAAQLLERELPDSGLRDYTRIIIGETDRLRNLVDHLLGPSRAPCFELMNIHEILERVCRLIDAETGGRVELVRDYDPSIPELSLDREQMIQAILNVMRNAMQTVAGQQDQRITLCTRTLRQYTLAQSRHRLVLKLGITDNGPGISEELMDTLFYPMVSGKPDGTGLGLSITQNIIGSHHGLIECDSQPGCTTFSIYLPIAQRGVS